MKSEYVMSSHIGASLKKKNAMCGPFYVFFGHKVIILH